MTEEYVDKERIKALISRVVKALLWSLLMGGEVLILYLSPYFGRYFAFIEPVEGSFFIVLLIFVAIEFLIQLTSGTILPYALSTARVLATIYLIYQWTNGGVYISNMLVQDIPVKVTVDFTVILNAFILLSLLTVLKNVLGGIGFLHQKGEESYKSM